MNSGPTPVTPVTRAARASAAPDPRRWLILGVVGLAQLMVVLDSIANQSTQQEDQGIVWSETERSPTGHDAH